MGPEQHDVGAERMTEDEMREVLALQAEMLEKEQQLQQQQSLEPSVGDVSSVLSLPEERVAMLLAEVRRRRADALQAADERIRQAFETGRPANVAPPAQQDFYQEEVYYRRTTASSPASTVVALIIFGVVALIVISMFVAFERRTNAQMESWPGPQFPRMGFGPPRVR